MHFYCKLPLSVELAAGAEDVHVCLVNVIFLCGVGGWRRRCTYMFDESYLSVWRWQLLRLAQEMLHECLVKVTFLCGVSGY